MTQLNLEATILTNLIYNSEYTRKVIPYIKAEYFQDITQKVVFQTIETYVNSYKSNPDTVSYTHLTLPTNREV